MSNKLCTQCQQAPRKMTRNGLELTMCETCQRDYWRRKKAESVTPRKPSPPKSPKADKPRGRPRKLLPLAHPVRVLVINRAENWIGCAQIEASSFRRISDCRSKSNIERLIAVFQHDGFSVQEIKDEV